MAESTESVNTKDSRTTKGSGSLGSLWPARFVFAILAIFALGSAFAFVFQCRYRDQFGDLFREQPGAWPHLLGHLLRSAVAASLAWSLVALCERQRSCQQVSSQI